MDGGQLIIVGAGGFSQEVISWADHAQQAGALPRIRGYLVDHGYPQLNQDYDLPCLGDLNGFSPQPGDTCLVAVSDVSPSHTPCAKNK